MAASSLQRSKVRAAWLFVTPTLIVLALVALWPLGQSFWLGFTDAELGPRSGRFVGFENFTDPVLGLIHDPSWWRSVWNTVVFTVFSVSIELLLGILVALLLHQSLPGRPILRAAILIPWALPTIVAGRMWHWMLNDQFGVLNAMMVNIGLIDAPIAWTARPETAMVAMIAVDIWKTTPFMALMILAGLQMLPQDCYEQARVDGIHPVRVFFAVTLPLLKPAIIVAVIFRALDTLRVFDLFYIMTSGTRDMMSMSMYARFQMVDNGNLGYGSAIATMIFFIIAIVAILFITATRFRLTGDRT